VRPNEVAKPHLARDEEQDEEEDGKMSRSQRIRGRLFNREISEIICAKKGEASVNRLAVSTIVKMKST